MIARNDWKSEAADLIRCVDPNAGPLYLFDFQEFDIQEGDVALACTSIFLDLQLRDRLKASGEWQGRGFVCLIDADHIEAQFHKSGIGRDARRRVLGIVLHEYAHFISYKLMPEEWVDRHLAELPDLAHYLSTAPITCGRDDPAAEPWRDHDGIRFGRGCIHLYHRANLSGQDFHINDIWSSAQTYRLAAPLDYVGALGDEPQSRLGEPLRAILDSPAPEPYADFCNQDLTRARARLALVSDNHSSEGTTMTANVLERIASHQQQQKSQAVDAYRALVRATEAGKDIAAPDAMRILEAAGKTPADLAAAVTLIRNRRGWVEQAGKLKETESALNALDAEEAAALKTLRDAQEEYKARRQSIIARRPALLGQHASCLSAIDQLERTADDPEILAAERELVAESQRLAVSERGIRGVLSDRKKHLATLRIKLGQARRGAMNWMKVPGFSGPAANAEAMAKEFSDFNRTSVEPLERQLAGIGEQRAAINRKSAELAEAKLVP
jgi:hypothetical protein